MNDQFKTSDFVERTDQDMNNPAVNPDPFAEKFPVDVVPVQEMPTGGNAAVVVPMDEAIPYIPPMSEPVADEFVERKPISYQAPESETITHKAPLASAALLSREESEQYRTRWNEIQGKFVDEPRSAVQEADALVSEVIEQITQMFGKEHSSLEGQWNQGNDVSTEDLRKALQYYRSFFNRLVV